MKQIVVHTRQVCHLAHRLSDFDNGASQLYFIYNLISIANSQRMLQTYKRQGELKWPDKYMSQFRKLLPLDPMAIQRSHKQPAPNY